MKKTIKTGVYGITVELSWSKEDEVSGTITSDLHDGEGQSAEYKAAIDGLESLILAHACAGIDITSPAYLEGIEVAVMAIMDRFE
jgi:hypothetical protein